MGRGEAPVPMPAQVTAEGAATAQVSAAACPTAPTALRRIPEAEARDRPTRPTRGETAPALCGLRRGESPRWTAFLRPTAMRPAPTTAEEDPAAASTLTA